MVKFYSGPIGGINKLVVEKVPHAGLKLSYQIFLLAIMVLISVNGYAQDLIVKQDKTNIEAKVVEITDEAVKYNRFDNLDGPVYSIKKADIFMIIYKNGKTESFSNSESQSVIAPPAQPAKPNPVTPSGDGLISAFKSNAEPVVAPGEVLKNKGRIMVSGGIFQTWDEPDFAIKAAYETVKPIAGFSGFGIAVNNLLDIYAHYSEFVTPANDDITITKHYLSGYLFKEYDTKFISAGFSGGLGLNHTRGSYYDGSSDETISASFNTVGIHTAQYLHKYIGTNSRGERNGFIRLGIDQYFMLQGNSTYLLHLAFGF